MPDIISIFIAKGGSIVLMLAVSGAIVLFLRGLYGPSGVFRKSTWNDGENELPNAGINDLDTSAHEGFEVKKTENFTPETNLTAQFSPSLQRTHSQTSAAPFAPLLPPNVPSWLHGHIDAFTQYYGLFLDNKPEITRQHELKYQHSLNVLDNALYISAHATGFSATMHRALLLAALYHDIGRFPQFTRYQTFSDAHSCDHGYLSGQTITRNAFMRHETLEVQRLAKTAVILHNKHSVSPRLPLHYTKILQAVRDADKLDILKVMANNLGHGKTPDPAVVLHLQDKPGKFSEKVLNDLHQGHAPSFVDMRYTNDFRLVLCAWVWALNFAASRQKALEDGYIFHIIDGMEGIDDIQHHMRQKIHLFLTEHTPTTQETS